MRISGYEIIVELESDNQLKEQVSLEIHCKYTQNLRITKKNDLKFYQLSSQNQYAFLLI